MAITPKYDVLLKRLRELDAVGPGSGTVTSVAGDGLARTGPDPNPPGNLPITVAGTINVPRATKDEAEAGTDNDVAMTPLRVAEAIQAQPAGGSPWTEDLTDGDIWRNFDPAIGTGRVGIGTNDPQYKLDLVGTSSFTGQAIFGEQIQILGGGVLGAGKVLTDVGGTGLATWENPAGGGSPWLPGTGDDIHRLDGNVGIGTITPTRKLDVVGDANISTSLGVGTDATIGGTIQIEGGTPVVGHVLTATDTNGLAAWQTNPSSPWSVTGNNIYYTTGRVGVGTTTPTGTLEVAGEVRQTTGVDTLKLTNSADSGAGRTAISLGNSNIPITDQRMAKISVMGGNSNYDNPSFYIEVADGVNGLQPRITIDKFGKIIFEQQIQIKGGTPGAGKVLTDVNGAGVATWEDAGGGTGTVTSVGAAGLATTTPDNPFTDTGTITVTASTNDQADAGTDVTTAMTPASTVQAISTHGEKPLWQKDLASENIYYNVIDGNVGIGTATPGHVLDVAGDARVKNHLHSADNILSLVPADGFYVRILPDSDTHGLVLRSKGGTVGTTYTSMLTTDEGFRIGVDINNPHIFIKKTTGDFGIGTDVPDTKLHVEGQIKITGGTPGVGKVLTDVAGTGLATWEPPTGDSSPWLPGTGDDIHRLDGNVGIGTITPTEKLEVVGTTKTDSLNVNGVVVTYENVVHPPIYHPGQTGLDDLSSSGAYTETGNATFQVMSVVEIPINQAAISDLTMWKSVAWSPTLMMFCATAQSSTSQQLVTSTNGIDWSERHQSGTGSDYEDIIWCPDLSIFCAIAFDGHSVISSDGINWTSGLPMRNEWGRIAWSPELSIFCAIATNHGGSQNVATSTDGLIWVIGQTIPSPTLGLSGIVWSPELSIFCACSWTSNIGNIITSPDGFAWTQQTVGFSNIWRAITWSPEQKIFSVVGTRGVDQDTTHVMTSPDGLTWTSGTIPTEVQLNDVVWSPELSLFCGINNRSTLTTIISYHSVDGLTWLPGIDYSHRAPWKNAAWSPELLIFSVVGDVQFLPVDERSRVSIDGISWVTTPFAIPVSGYVWRKSRLDPWSDLVEIIAGVPQLLSDGVSITFESDAGHTNGDIWDIDVGLDTNITDSLRVEGTGKFSRSVLIRGDAAVEGFMSAKYGVSDGDFFFSDPDAAGTQVSDEDIINSLGTGILEEQKYNGRNVMSMRYLYYTRAPIYVSGQTGLDDLTSFGEYSLPGSSSFYVKISQVQQGGDSEELVWKKGVEGTWSSPIVNAGVSILMQDGISFQLGSVGGHTLSDIWIIGVGGSMEMTSSLYGKGSSLIEGDLTLSGTLGSGGPIRIAEGIDLVRDATIKTDESSLKLSAGGTSPQIVVEGQIKITGGVPGAGKVLTDVGGTGLATWEPAGGGGDSPWESQPNTDNIFYDNNGGFVGIGTDAPVTELEVEGDITSTGTKWKPSVPPTGLSLHGIAYGNGVFVAISRDGQVEQVTISPDGIHWTDQETPSDHDWQGVCYGNGVFVAVGLIGSVMTSPDGVTWTLRGSGTTNFWRAVSYGNGLFVAVADSGTGDRVMTSPDGITWMVRVSATDNEWVDVTYGRNLFVAVSYAGTGTGDRVMTSPDGITWTTRQSAADYSWQGLTCGNGLFVAVAASGTGDRVMTSPDGVTWTLLTGILDNNWQSVAYGKGLFVAVANTGSEETRVMISPDGAAWTPKSGAGVNLWLDIAYGNGVFVAISPSGPSNQVMISGKIENNVNQTDNFHQGGLTIAGDIGTGLNESGHDNTLVALEVLGNIISAGTQWLARSAISTTASWRAIAYGNGTFVAVASDGIGSHVMTSPDGVTWTPRTASIIHAWNGIVYGAGLFVAVALDGDGDSLMTSPDGVTWTTQVTPLQDSWTSIAYGKGTFVVVCGDTTTTEQVLTSLDGVVWTPRIAAVPTEWTSITYGDGQFVAGGIGPGGTTNTIMTSPDGITWTQQATSTDDNIQGIAYGNGTYVTVASSGASRIMTSPDAVTWTTRTPPVINQWLAVTYGDGLFVAVASSGTGDRVITSPNGIRWTVRANTADSSWAGVTFGNGMFAAVAHGLQDVPIMTSGVCKENIIPVDNIHQGNFSISQQIRIVGGNPGANKVLTSLSDTGLGTWEDPSVGGGDSLWEETPEGHIYRLDGNVGIGTITPAEKLEVAGRAKVESLDVNGAVITYEDLVRQPVYTPGQTGLDDLSSSGTYEGTDSVSYQVMTTTDTNSLLEGKSIEDLTFWRSVVWSPKLLIFCAAASGNGKYEIVTSRNGIHWITRHTSENDTNYQDIIWAPELGIFCAVDSDGRSITSPNGIAWDSNPNATKMRGQWREVAWSPKLGLFCAISKLDNSTQNVMTSTDGLFWVLGITTRAGTDPIDLSGITWSPKLGIFCACSTSEVDDAIITSSDAINWTKQNVGFSEIWRDIAWSPELEIFSVVGDSIKNNGNEHVMTSPDGVTWTQGTAPIDSELSAIVWSPELSLFCASNRDKKKSISLYSDDGLTWMEGTDHDIDAAWRNITWSPHLSVFCVVGEVGDLTGNAVRTGISTDGASWSISAPMLPTHGYIWRKNYSEAWSGLYQIFPGTLQLLSHGVFITFQSDIGHTEGDTWDIDVGPYTNISKSLRAEGVVKFNNDLIVQGGIAINGVLTTRVSISDTDALLSDDTSLTNSIDDMINSSRTGTRRQSTYMTRRFLTGVRPPMYVPGQTGLDDLMSSGRYIYEGSSSFYVKISQVQQGGDSEEAMWKKGVNGIWSSPIDHDGDSIPMQDGVSFQFDSIGGHTLNDVWIITAGSYYQLSASTHIQDSSLIEGDLTLSGVLGAGGGVYLVRNALITTDEPLLRLSAEESDLQVSVDNEGTLKVDGAIIVDAYVSIDSYLEVNQWLQVEGSATFQSHSIFNGDAEFRGRLSIQTLNFRVKTPNLKLGYVLTCVNNDGLVDWRPIAPPLTSSSDGSLATDVDVDGDLTVKGKIRGRGDVQFEDDLEISDKLKVEGEATFKKQIQIQSGNPGPGKVLTDVTGTGLATWEPTTPASLWKEDPGSDDIYRLDGNVGIGTEAPSARLQVQETSTNFTDIGSEVLLVRKDITLTTADPISYTLATSRQSTDTPALYLGCDIENNAILATNNGDLIIGDNLSGVFSEKMRVTQAGKVWIEDLGVSGKTTLKYLDVTGHETISGTLQVTGESDLGGINVTGSSYLKGPLEVTGFTRLGDNAPAVKMKILEGRLDPNPDTINEVPHGLAEGKILTYDTQVEWGTDVYAQVGPESTADVSGKKNQLLYSTFIYGEHIRIGIQAGQGSLVLGKRFRIVVTYQE